MRAHIHTLSPTHEPCVYVRVYLTNKLKYYKIREIYTNNGLEIKLYRSKYLSVEEGVRDLEIENERKIKEIFLNI